MPVCGPPGGEPCPQLPRLPARHPLLCRLHLGLMVPFLQASGEWLCRRAGQQAGPLRAGPAGGPG